LKSTVSAIPEIPGSLPYVNMNVENGLSYRQWLICMHKLFISTAISATVVDISGELSDTEVDRPGPNATSCRVN